jgi:glycosyltransferase involved in cell wall biosynthesis
MKVLQIINSLNTGGAERLLLDSVPLYNKTGMEMDMLLLNSSESPFLQELQRLQIRIITLSKGRIKSIYNPLLIFKLIKYIKRYDILHVHLFPSLYWVALAQMLSRAKTKLVFTEHNTSNNRRNIKLLRFLDRLVYKRYAAVVSISEGVDAALQEHLLLKKGLFHIIANGIDLSKFHGNSNKFPDLRNNITLIQVSRFSASKDQATLIRALSHLPDNVKVVFVGDGETRTECEVLVQRLDLSERVTFLGNRGDVPDLLAQSDIAVQSSHWEGFGLAAVEAMASGLPTVASNVSGLRDVVGGAGVLFSSGDARELADRILQLIDDRNLYAHTSASCLERAKEFDINRMVENYIEIYNSIQSDLKVV